MDEHPVIEAAHLACRRGERLLFEDLSFELAPGDALLLKGPNGSGKSSLLRMLAGFLPLAAGRISIGGTLIDHADARSQMVYAGHANPLKPALSVAANVFFLQALAGGASAKEMMHSLGLDDIANMPARYLSSGQRRRTTLAACLASDRPIWLLDEPGVGLDRHYRGCLEGIISQHLATGGVVIAASHGDIELFDPLVLDFSRSAET